MTKEEFESRLKSAWTPQQIIDLWNQAVSEIKEDK